MEVSVWTIDMVEYMKSPICVEHWGERMALFVMLHLGESMFAMISDFTGVQSFKPYIATAFALIIAFAFRRVYFEIEGREPKNPHALRRHRATRVAWTFSHWILCMSIIVFASGIHGLLDAVITNSTNTELGEQMGNLTALDRAGKLPTLADLTKNTPPPEGRKRAEDVALNNTSSADDGIITDYLLFRQSQALFCGGLALMVGMVFFQTMLSVGNIEVERYRLKQSQYLRLGLRVVVIIILSCIPAISRAAVSIDAFVTICFVGCVFFGWALTESFLVIRNEEKKKEAKPLGESFTKV